MAHFEPGKGPVVLCFKDGSAPAGAVATVTLDALPVEAAWFAAGTGGDRLDVVAAARTLADRPHALAGTPLEPLVEHIRMNPGTDTDFYTGRERPKCRLHLFVDVVKDGAAVQALQALLEVLLPYDLPLGIHAFLSGPEKTAYFSFNPILDMVGEKVPVMTMCGAEYAFGPDTDWDKVLDAYRALVVLFEGEVYRTVDHALEDNYAFERDDVAMPPIRLGEFEGIRGDLRLEFPAPPGAPPEPPWEWHGDDLGLIVTSRGDHMERLLRILTRSGLPDDVVKMVTLRGRPVITFDASTLMTLVPMLGSSVPSLFDTRAKSALLEIAAAAGKRCARVLDVAHSALGTFALDGDRDLESNTTVEPDAAAAIAKAASATADADLLFVGVGDADLEPLRTAVADRGGALLVVAGGQLSLFGEGITVEGERGAYRDLFATALALSAIEAPATSARSLVKQ